MGCMGRYRWCTDRCTVRGVQVNLRPWPMAGWWHTSFDRISAALWLGFLQFVWSDRPSPTLAARSQEWPWPFESSICDCSTDMRRLPNCASKCRLRTSCHCRRCPKWERLAASAATVKHQSLEWMEGLLRDSGKWRFLGNRRCCSAWGLGFWIAGGGIGFRSVLSHTWPSYRFHPIPGVCQAGWARRLAFPTRSLFMLAGRRWHGWHRWRLCKGRIRQTQHANGWCCQCTGVSLFLLSTYAPPKLCGVKVPNQSRGSKKTSALFPWVTSP